MAIYFNDRNSVSLGPRSYLMFSYISQMYRNFATYRRSETRNGYVLLLIDISRPKQLRAADAFKMRDHPTRFSRESAFLIESTLLHYSQRSTEILFTCFYFYSGQVN